MKRKHTISELMRCRTPGLLTAVFATLLSALAGVGDTTTLLPREDRGASGPGPTLNRTLLVALLLLSVDGGFAGWSKRWSRGAETCRGSFHTFHDSDADSACLSSDPSLPPCTRNSTK